MLILAIAIAGFSVMTIRGQMAQAPAVQEKQVVRVLVARRDLAMGTFIQGSQDLDFALPPESTETPAPAAEEEAKTEDGKPAEVPVVVREPFFMENSVKLEDFNGAVVRRTLKAGEPVPQSALMKSGEGGFLSAVLDPGKRAVSIAVNATTGNAGFVSPGDRVDLIVTRRFKSQNSGDDTVVSETFVRELRVVAVDQMIDNPENKAILAKTVTVECTPHQAEQIAVATEMGKISLALRSIGKSDQEKAEDEQKSKQQAEAASGVAVKLIGGDGQPILAPVMAQVPGDGRVLTVPRVQVIRGEKTETLDFTLSQP